MLTLVLAAAVQVTVHARALQPGELAVLSIALPEPRARIRVRAFDHDLAAFPDADPPRDWRALVGIDLDTRPGRYSVDVDTGDGFAAATTLVVEPKAFPTRRLTVDEGFVNPPASVASRIERESRLLATIWAHPAANRLWSGPFVRPVPQPANSRFGTRSVFNGRPRNPHGGADFPSPTGTPIHAPNAGHVVLAQNLYFSGGTVVIDHGQGLFSTLAHLSAIDVHEGDRVETGAVVGRVGATGRVTGPHLHWAVRLNAARVDPLALLALLGGG